MLIYLCHPFGNQDSNRGKVARIIDNLIYEYPEHNWLSPIHATGHWYKAMSYERGMDWCLALLDKCDEMWVYGDFQVGDYLALAEWDREYTGRGVTVKITYILNTTEMSYVQDKNSKIG